MRNFDPVHFKCQSEKFLHLVVVYLSSCRSVCQSPTLKKNFVFFILDFSFYCFYLILFAKITLLTVFLQLVIRYLTAKPLCNRLF